MSDNYDQLALSWVRKEINNTLEQARQGLENFAEDSQDQTQIQFCINCLHQVQGTLQMLDFSGAAKLAFEMEFLAEKMATDPTYAVSSAFEILMRALLQMPGYLERVEEGQKDIPVILLPLINQIRAASNQSPVAEKELFSADTSNVAPPKAVETVTDKEKTTSLQDNTKKLRSHFQKGLTSVIRGENIKDSLGRIHKVLLRLEALTEGASVAKLWWVADGFIFSITEKGLYKKKEIHQLLGQVDKHIGRLAELGENALNDVVPEKLLSQLLYFVARSNSKNSRIKALKDEFKLEHALADSEHIKERQAKLAKPDVSAVTNVAGALNEELASIKDQLDLFVRSQAKEVSQLQTLVDSLNRIADTLTLLELAIPRDVIRQQTLQIQKQIDLDQMPGDGMIMDIAGALLFVEANLKNINLDEVVENTGDDYDANQSSKAQAKDAQVDEATQTLIKVARRSMQAAKDKIIGYIAAGLDTNALIDVPALLEEVIGGVQIVQFDMAGNFLKTAKDFIDYQILNKAVQPNEISLDALADVITSVEYYLEASEEGKYRGIDSILKGAEGSLETLTEALKEKVLPVLSFDDNISVEPQTSNLDDANNIVNLIEEKASDAAAEAVTEVKPILAASTQKQADISLIDDEVLEIFLEEAEEEIESISEMLPRWSNNPQDQDALSTLRRSFHTLKGSGRLVGADIIGDLGWSVENMLNKVIEESIPAESPVLSVLSETLILLPRLVEAFSNKQLPDNAYLTLVAKAKHIAEGKPLSEFNFEQVESDLEVVSTETVETTIQDDAIDPVLLEIFSTEAASHLDAINRYTEAAPTEGSVAVTDELIRALHTLKGSAKMANVEAMAGLTGPWEKFARVVKGSGKRFDQPVMTLLKNSAAYLTESLDALKNSQTIDMQKEQGLLDELALFKADGVNSATSASQQRDQRLVSIFLTEGLDILHEVGDLNHKLIKDSTNNQIKDSIRSELHSFHRGAEMLAIDELGSLAVASEKLILAVISRDDIPESFYSLLDDTLESLTSILNKIASEEDLEPSLNSVARIEDWISNLDIEAIPDDMDEELVELFVEEGEELIESARELLARWKDNLTSKELITDLRRTYHTVKGSSRMAGAMNIGDLGHAAEDIFNTILDYGRIASEQDYPVTITATDKLESMIAELKTLHWPGAAPTEIKMIRQLLSPESDVVVEATPLEEVAETTFDDTLVLDTEAIVENEIELIDVEALESESSESEIIELEEIEIESLGNEIFEEEISLDDIPMVVEEVDTELSDQEIPIVVEQVDDILDLTDNSLEQPLVVDELTFEQETKQAEQDPVDLVSDSDEENIPVAEDVYDEEIISAELENEIESPQRSSDTNKLSENTISPTAPIVVSGNVHQIELDEDGEEVLEIYLEEAEELLIALDEALHEWAGDLSNKNAIDLLQRTLHTFKGGARLSDLVILGDLTHEMETYFERINSGQIKAKPADVDFLLKGYDVIAGLVSEVEKDRQMTVPAAYMVSLDALIKGKNIQPVESLSEEPLQELPVEAVESDTVVDIVQPSVAEVVSFEEKKQQVDNKQKQAKATDIIRVPSEQLEELVNLAGETSIFRSRLEQQMSVLRYNLEEMSATVERLRDQLRNLDIETDAQISYRKEISGGIEYDDFDPLEMDRYTRQQELTRSLGESAVDLVSLKESLDTLTSDSETLLLQQGRVNTEMQESLMRTRMIPFESLVPRLRRMVRQISSELDKTIELSINADGEMDRSVLERLIAPLEHMLRNAMDHGIEPEDERRAKNKRAAGNVKISLYREGSEVYVKIQDDGRGLNLKAIRTKAIERGLINQDSELSDHELQQLILEAGFSTAEQVTQISGRGVGMDVVSSEIKQMGGVIEIDSIEGIGSTFTIKLPFTVSVNHALMVQLGEEVFAIPLANIEGIVRVSPFELEEYYSNSESRFEYAGVDYSMYALNQLLDHEKTAQLKGVTQALPVLLLHGADHPTALQVDGLLGSREIVVKSIGSQLSSVSGLSGATILGDGRVVLILDLPALIRRIDARVIEGELSDGVEHAAVEIEEDKIPKIMVVDDSITVRKVTTRLLERHDFEVITAKDGIDALSVLAEHKPDVMLLDIEMPRMDGFELATIIRHDDNLKDLPIIMITSRTGGKHRERAEQIGVDRYMGKPYNEVDLIETISELLETKD